MTLADPSLARDFEAALAWWRNAGVDCDFHNDATAWLADQPLERVVTTARGASAGPEAARSERSAPLPSNAAPITAAPSAPPLPESHDLLGESPPADLAAFHSWWLSDPALGSAKLYPRIAPRGTSGAPLMVLVPQPEEHDRTALLEGPQGRLLANMLAAMGFAPENIYLASALPCHTPMADLVALGSTGLDKVLAHHIALAAPQRLLVLGTGLAALLKPGADHSLREINHVAGKLPVMVSEALDALMDMPRLKARFWRRWMEWSATQ